VEKIIARYYLPPLWLASDSITVVKTDLEQKSLLFKAIKKNLLFKAFKSIMLFM